MSCSGATNGEYQSCKSHDRVTSCQGSNMTEKSCDPGMVFDIKATKCVKDTVQVKVNTGRVLCTSVKD